MVELKQFKTKLCIAYQRGRCTRQNCTFAHGNAELRRFSSSYGGRRDYLGNDLRDKLDRRHLSPRRYPPARHVRGRQTIHEDSPPRSLEEKKKHRKKHGITSQSDVSGGLKVSDRIEDHVKEANLLSSGSRNNLEEQLKNVRLDIGKLEHRKFQLGVYLDESVQEVDSLNSRIQELEAQLCKENEKCKGITSKIRKFIKAHNHNSRLQDELKRSQVRLQKLGNQLTSDIAGIGINEEDLTIDIVSNGENIGFPSTIKHKVERNEASPRRKRLRDAVDKSKRAKSARTRKRSRWNVPAPLNDKEEYVGLEVPHDGTEVTRPLDLEGTRKRGINTPSNNLYPEKLKGSRIELPSTSMAAHMVDEEVDIELDDKTDILETARREDEHGAAFESKGLPLLLPPASTLHNNYSRYEGDDQNVDVDGLDKMSGHILSALLRASENSQTSTGFIAILAHLTIKHLRPLMDSQQPESDTTAVEGEDFIHIENPNIESLSESMIGTDDPASTSLNTEESEHQKVLAEDLSGNVVTLTCESSAEGGVCDVYVVGTAHVSEESCREVQAIINFLKPQVVFLELCSSRVTVLTPQNLKVPTVGEMIGMLKKNHNIFAVLYSWFLAKVASKLDVFPGSEFRVAYEEALKYGGRVILGDRPVQITVMRTWRKMSLWHKTKLVYSLLSQAVFLPSSDDLYNMLKEMDDSDMLTLVIQEMSKQFPTLMETLVHERDQYMSATLLKVASENNSVVAVVGKGHLQGIKNHWKQPVAVRDLMTIPSPKPAISAVRILTSVVVAVAGIAIISGIYISSKK
ncbi:hypothetical protein L6164_018822 [Bauhinia variegata]|uniref:Uncharacterized protein n=1 Tax=Bauhinia variegata TaxID=167791 RepID=A0ACB9NE49_BAUVA|nr:hypothetical protein L6164_018822 [Bauhinia variegata]